VSKARSKRKPKFSGKVSYYTNKSVDPRWGGITKGGEKFDEDKMTAAVLPQNWLDYKGKELLVVSREDPSKRVRVKINDTGGFEKYNRVMDLSKRAFSSIADPKKGIVDADVYETPPWYYEALDDPNIQAWWKQLQERGARGPMLGHMWRGIHDPRGYNYADAIESGGRPSPNKDGEYHWGSSAPDGQLLKGPLHPTLWKEFAARMGIQVD
jgi:hypothetical protein